MHNCKATREALVALALNQSHQTPSLPAELETCATCREEYAALRSSLRVADQARQSALPGESFWPGYHARLRQHLETRSQLAVTAPAVETRNNLPTMLQDLLMTSIRVPVPLAAAAAVLLILLGGSLVIALNSRRPISAAPPVIVTKTIEAPVPQETIRDKVVTRIVYRDRDRRPSPSAKVNAVAGRQARPTAETPISLVGFKPTNEVNLTVIKGSYRDDK
jgi:hypothetical protein